MIYLAWILTLIASFCLGYKFKHITERVEVIEAEIKKKVEKPTEEPESFIVDELDEIQVAQAEHKKMLDELNE